MHTLYMTFLLQGSCVTASFEKQKRLEGSYKCFMLFVFEAHAAGSLLCWSLGLTAGSALLLPMGQHLAHLEREDSLEHWPYSKAVMAVFEMLEPISLECLMTVLMIGAELEMEELMRRLPANLLPKAEQYSIFEAHGSFSSSGGELCALHP